MKLKVGNDALEFAKANLSIDRVMEDLEKMERFVEIGDEGNTFRGALADLRLKVGVVRATVNNRFREDPDCDFVEIIENVRKELEL